MTNDISIREELPGERSQILNLTLEAYAEYEAVMPEAFWKTYRQRLIDTVEATGPVTRLVALQGGQDILGSVLLYPPRTSTYGGFVESNDYPEVRFLAVAPSGRGKGIGTALMAECIIRTRNWGAEALGLHTMSLMRSALRMYEQMGFVRTPEQDFQVGEVLVMGFRYYLPER